MNNEILALLDEYGKIADIEGLLPIRVSKFYRQKVHKELEHLKEPIGPLYRAVYPTREKNTLRQPNEVLDFVDDRRNMPANLKDFAVRKYRDRMLFFPTPNCLSHCQYCFRQDVLGELDKSRDKSRLQLRLKALTEYLNNHKEISEVILSGGDPMILSNKDLEFVLQALRENTNILNIRIHTRALIFTPQIFDKTRVRILKEFNIKLVNHIIHPYEICEQVERSLIMLNESNIKLYNQFPILRNINDHPYVLEKLLRKLDGFNVRNLSIFIPDPIKYSASYRIKLSRIFEIMRILNQNTPSWVNATRLVLDSPIGKLRKEDITSNSEEIGEYIFEKQGEQIKYYDFPESLDIPGKIEVLLWRN